MLKISTISIPHGTGLALAGRLVGPWVQELRRCWHEMESLGSAPQYVDLRETTFLDDEGKALLFEMHRQGIRLVAHGCMMRAIVENLTAKSASDNHCPGSDLEPNT
ncbi:hypothetical protein YTPLAS18_00220 [Nitrospira sp.]|nr:hypothetical protein YTPLAS18_00220 [Nitrospira sp.]